MRRALLLATLLLLPLASASAAHEASGWLALADGAALRGGLDAEGAGILEVAPGEVRVGFGALADGWLVDRTRDRVHLGLPYAEDASASAPRVANETLPAVGAGRVENVRCGLAACLVALVASPESGALGVRGFVDDAFAPTRQAREVATVGTPQGSADSRWAYDIPAGALAVQSSQLRDAQPWASGRVTLVLSDVVFDLVTEDGRRTVDARWENETTQAAAGQPVQVRHHARHALLLLDDPELAVSAPFRLTFPDGADARLGGALASGDATGALTVAEARRAVDHERVLVEGDFALQLRGDPTGALGVAFEGEATRAVVQGASVVPVVAPSAARAGEGLLALLAVALLGRLVVAPLYHRLGPSDVLANENRRGLYETIRARPGVSVQELVASSGLSRILVRHHLGMLEAHKLVRATSWRRRRTYAVAGEGAGRAACELKDATRRRVAHAVTRAGRATQKDLVGTLGVSQRLVSYHLARLEASALVKVEGRNPRAYVATEELARALEREEGALPTTSATAA